MPAVAATRSQYNVSSSASDHGLKLCHIEDCFLNEYSLAPFAAVHPRIMALPSIAAAPASGEPTPHMQFDVQGSGVFHRMEESDPTQRFRNQMALLVWADGSARLEQNGREPVTLHVVWENKCTLTIDWTPVNKSWGRSQLRVGFMGGAPGLVENSTKFWKLASVLACEAVHPTRESDSNLPALAKHRQPAAAEPRADIVSRDTIRARKRRPPSIINSYRLDAPELPLPKLQIITCGVRDAGLEDFHGDALRNGLDAFVSYFVDRVPGTCFCKPVMHFDMRSFHDPRRSELQDHLGRHPEIIARLVADRNFPRWLAYVRREFVSVLREWGSRVAATATMSVIVFCRSGRHRSVAGSEILRHVASHVEFFECLPTVHCSLDGRFADCCCPKCRPNRLHCESVRNSMMTAVDLWCRPSL